MSKPVVYHIPVCPFCQRLEILLTLKGRRDEVDFMVIDVTRPRPEWLLEKTRGTTSLPVLELANGAILKESLVIQQYLDEVYGDTLIAQRDPYLRAIENMLTRMEGEFVVQGYRWILNQDVARRETFRDGMLALYAHFNDFLVQHSTGGPFLFDKFGWAETVFTPFFMRFWFLEYYENFELPDEARYERVRVWRQACLAHPAAQQTSREEIVKLYYDYAKGAGNGALLPGRQVSSFSFEPAWADRPWPSADKYARSATDEELGLV